MGTCYEAEDQFFDTRDEITSASDLGSDFSEEFSVSGNMNCVLNGLGYETFTKTPETIHERRLRFLKWMGLSSDWHLTEGEEPKSGYSSCDETKISIDRIEHYSGAVLANSESEQQFVSSSSSLSRQSNEAQELIRDGAFKDNLAYKFRNLDDGSEFVVDELNQDGTLSRLREVGSNRLVMIEEFQRTLGSSSLVLRFLRRDAKMSNVVDMEKKEKKAKRGWFKKLRGVTHSKDKQDIKPSVQKVRVHSSRKRTKELSSLFAGQEFPAHEGSILTMKFSRDGQYLASAGEDGVVRVWKVIEDEGSNRLNIQDNDPSCLYFSLNHFSNLAPLAEDKERIDQMKKWRKSSESACVIFPPKAFRILEKPLHEFNGHCGEVLALSWSDKGYLLSSSVDKTVRLWQVGHDECLRIFSHNNYVTSVEFNPVDENYFISGSIDGKVRIWEVRSCQVVDWTDIREIVTAVCYYPDGKRGIVGSMDGNCRFYEIIENCLQLSGQICLLGKKKLPGRRVTGFQFCPSDPTKVMVTSADSHVRVLSGHNIIDKFRGKRTSGNLLYASFTLDGKHIISASEDSNVYIWNHINTDHTSSKPRNINSFENFFSCNASIAIPWCGMKTQPHTLLSPTTFSGDDDIKSHVNEDLLHKMTLSPPDCFSLGRGFFLEHLHRGTATWPEEKLPDSSPAAPLSPSMCKSEYKFLKSACLSTVKSPHMWGLVIVSAGWDGRIRTYLNYGLPLRP